MNSKIISIFVYYIFCLIKWGLPVSGTDKLLKCHRFMGLCDCILTWLQKSLFELFFNLRVIKSVRPTFFLFFMLYAQIYAGTHSDNVWVSYSCFFFPLMISPGSPSHLSCLHHIRNDAALHHEHWGGIGVLGMTILYDCINAQSQ